MAPEGDPTRPYALVDDRVWFVDTGASRTTCDDDFVASLGLEARPTLLRAHGEVGSVPIRRVVLRDVTIGGWTFRRLPCAVRDLATTSSLPHDPADPVVGILGANLFRTLVVDLDFRERRLRLLDEAPDLPGARVRREHGVGPRLVARLEVDGAPIDAVVDTGADRTYLPLESGEEVARYPAERQGTGPGGAAVVEVVIRRVERASLGGRALPLTQYVYRRGRPGLLGMDALGFARVVVDARARRVAWEPGEAPPYLTPDEARRAALEADGSDAGRRALAAWELAHGDADRAVDLYARLGDEPARVRALFRSGRWEEGRAAAMRLGGDWAGLVDVVERRAAAEPGVLAATFGGAGEPPRLGELLLRLRAGESVAGLAAPGVAEVLAALEVDRVAPGAAAAACARLPAPREAEAVLLLVACGQLDRATDALAGMVPGAVRPPGMSTARARAAWLDAHALLAAARGDAAGAEQSLELAVRLAPWDPYLHARRGEVAAGR